MRRPACHVEMSFAFDDGARADATLGAGGRRRTYDAAGAGRPRHDAHGHA